VGAIVLAACVAFPAAADMLIVNGEKMSNVVVTGYSDGKITYKRKGETITVDVTYVQQIEIGGDDELNHAEKLAAKGDKGMVAAYEVAVKKTKGPWHIALAKKRLVMAMAGDFPVLTRATMPKPTVKPPPAPASQPTSRPKPEPEPEPEIPPNLDAISRALATANNLFDTCREMPVDPRRSPNWPDMDEEHRAPLLRDYETEMKKWNAEHNVRGRMVSWTLHATKAGRKDGRVVLTLQAGEEITVEATFSAAASETKLPDLKDGDNKVRVTGVLRDYQYKHGEKTIFMESGATLSVTLDEAYLGDKPPPAAKK